MNQNKHISQTHTVQPARIVLLCPYGGPTTHTAKNGKVPPHQISRYAGIELITCKMTLSWLLVGHDVRASLI